jgi:hypothetical protein
MLIKETKVGSAETNAGTRGNPNAARTLVGTDCSGLRTGTVFMLKTVYAIIAAAIIAACLVFAPSLSPQVEAGAPSATGKADRADARPIAGDCSERPWPYMEASCLRDTRNPMGQAREVRFVPMGTPGAPRRPAGKPAAAAKVIKPVVASR